jgi:antibiotic biosynthesis monooxygenase (ABM) superfamily enzyme
VTAVDPVTTVVRRTVRPGREAEFESWIQRTSNLARVAPGYLGTTIIRPAVFGDSRYTLLVRFDGPDRMLAWESSPERAALIREADALCDGPVERQALTGLEAWFVLPGQPAVAPPPRHKMAIVSWLAAFPLLQLLGFLLGPLLRWVPRLAGAALSAALMIALMTYAVMPFMTRVFRRWLFEAR